jgi:hypothetical protein
MRRGYFAVLALVIFLGVILVSFTLDGFLDRALAQEAFPTGRIEAQKESLDQSRDTSRTSTTLPLRWYVSSVNENAAGTDNAYCMSAVRVRNVTTSVVTAEVEWVTFQGVSLDVRSLSVPARGHRTFITDDDVSSEPFGSSDNANLIDFGGFAQVHASDPRIIVSAFLVCRTGTGPATNIVSITNLPAYPVGDFLGVFQADLPMLHDSPMAENPALPR